jgi:sugar lactone lactonase YvrE
VGRVLGVTPAAATPGGRVTITGEGLEGSGSRLPDVRFDSEPARVLSARGSRIVAAVPPSVTAGPTRLTVAGADGAAMLQTPHLLADGLHQVDSPVFDQSGRLYVTYSGARGQQVPVSIFRIGRDGGRESLVTGLVNPTSMAFGPDGLLYVSSRFEGVVYRVDEGGHFETAVTDVGVACGLAFTAEGALLVGDRSGTIFRVLRNGKASVVATLPPSVAAFHLTMGPDGWLYVSAPTLTARDRVYRVSLEGKAEIAWTGFGRPQGLTCGPDGALYITEALAGASGVYRVDPRSSEPPVLVASGAGLVGVAFDPLGGMVVTTNDVAFAFGALTVDG